MDTFEIPLGIAEVKIEKVETTQGRVNPYCKQATCRPEVQDQNSSLTSNASSNKPLFDDHCP
jgi:hypothetical protein